MMTKALAIVLGVVISQLALAGTVQDRSFTLRGRIVDLMGNPIARAEVSGYRLTRFVPEEDNLVRKTVSDDLGFYELVDLPSDYYRLYSGSPGFRNSEVWRVLPWRTPIVDMGLAVGELTNDSPDVIAGTVSTSSGRRIENATVTAISAFNHSYFRQVRTDKTGRYRLELPARGQVIVYAAATEYLVDVELIVAGDTNTKDFSLQPLHSR